MIHDLVLDYGLHVLIRDSKRLLLNTVLATNYDTATIGTNVIGIQSPPIISGPQNAIPKGRRVIVNEITDGSVVLDGTVSAWALVDDINHRCLISGLLALPIDLETGNVFTLESFSITFPGVS